MGRVGGRNPNFPPAVRRLTTWTQSIFPRTGCAPTFVAPTATSPHSHVDGCESNLRLSCELTSALVLHRCLGKEHNGAMPRLARRVRRRLRVQRIPQPLQPLTKQLVQTRRAGQSELELAPTTVGLQRNHQQGQEPEGAVHRGARGGTTTLTRRLPNPLSTLRAAKAFGAFSTSVRVSASTFASIASAASKPLELTDGIVCTTTIVCVYV